MAEISKVRFGGVDYNLKSITDTSLIENGTPADAKATGDAITELKNDLKSTVINEDGIIKHYLQTGIASDITLDGESESISDVNIYDSSTMDVSGKWIGGDGNINNSDTSKYAKISVIPNAKYLICYNASTPQYTKGSGGGWLIQNVFGETIAQIDQSTLESGPMIGPYFSKYIIIPADGAYLLITVKFATSWDNTQTLTLNEVNKSGDIVEIYGLPIKDAAVSTQIDTIQHVQQGIINGSELDAVIVNKSASRDDENLYESTMLVADKWITPEGEIKNSSGSYYAKIPVNSGNDYVLCYYNSTPHFLSTSSGAYLIQDVNGGTASIILPENVDSYGNISGYEAKKIHIPDDGAFLLLTLKLSTIWDRRSDFALYHITYSGGKLIGLYGASVGTGYNWNSLKWTVVGDSITEKNLRSTIGYYDYIQDKTGVNVVNMGSSGTGYMRDKENNKAFYQRIVNVPLDTDVVTIFGSGNDLAYPAMGFSDFATALGNVDDTGTESICGCINTTIDTLYSILPTVQLGIVTPAPWQAFPPYSEINNWMKIYSEAIVSICERRGIPCLDLYHCSGLRPWESDYRQLCYSKDEGNGTHPNELGHKIMSSHFFAFMQSLIGTY